MASNTADLIPLRLQHNDTITIRNLRLDQPIEAPEAWDPLNKERLQPASVSVVVYLRNGFPSAAAADALDTNTLHYGELAKEIRNETRLRKSLATLPHGTSPGISHVLGHVHAVIFDHPHRDQVQGIDVEVALPKGSMFGKGVRVIDELMWRLDGSEGRSDRRIVVEEIHTACLIGVNAIERTGRQPLVVDFELQGGTLYGMSSDTTILQRAFNIEKLLVDIIEQTSFETLERLIEHTYAQLCATWLGEHFPGAVFRLSIAKPRAIIFADAPIVEIRRTIPSRA